MVGESYTQQFSDFIISVIRLSLCLVYNQTRRERVSCTQRKISVRKNTEVSQNDITEECISH